MVSEVNDKTGPIRVGAGRPSRTVIGVAVLVVLAGVCAVIPPVAVIGFLLSALAIVPAVVAFVRARRRHFVNTGLARTVLIAAPGVLVVSFVVIGLTATPAPRAVEDASSVAATSASAAPASPVVVPPALPPAAPVVAPAAPVAPPAPPARVAAQTPAPMAAPAPVAVVAAAPAVRVSAPAPTTSSSCDESTHYINSSHACVPRPVAAPSAPAGATAQCNDGTYSFSQHRQGTCSGHRGVQTWL